MLLQVMDQQQQQQPQQPQQQQQQQQHHHPHLGGLSTTTNSSGSGSNNNNNNNGGSSNNNNSGSNNNNNNSGSNNNNNSSNSGTVPVSAQRPLSNGGNAAPGTISVSSGLTGESGANGGGSGAGGDRCNSSNNNNNNSNSGGAGGGGGGGGRGENGRGCVDASMAINCASVPPPPAACLPHTTQAAPTRTATPAASASATTTTSTAAATTITTTTAAAATTTTTAAATTKTLPPPSSTTATTTTATTTTSSPAVTTTTPAEAEAVTAAVKPQQTHQGAAAITAAAPTEDSVGNRGDVSAPALLVSGATNRPLLTTTTTTATTVKGGSTTSSTASTTCTTTCTTTASSATSATSGTASCTTTGGGRTSSSSCTAASVVTALPARTTAVPVSASTAAAAVSSHHHHYSSAPTTTTTTTTTIMTNNCTASASIASTKTAAATGATAAATTTTPASAPAVAGGNSAAISGAGVGGVAPATSAAIPPTVAPAAAAAAATTTTPNSNNSCSASMNSSGSTTATTNASHSLLPALRRPEDVLRMAGQNDKLKFTMLIGLLQATPGQASKDVMHTVLHLLVGGEFDMELNFVINHPKNIIYMLDLLDHSSTQLQAELWSVLCAMLKKSVRNLQACTEVHLIEHILARLAEVDQVVADLVIEVLGVLASYSITVRELKLFVGYLRASGTGSWGPHSVRLLSVLRALPHRPGPDSFFSFSGKKGSAIALPPLSRWPYQSGWTLCTWFRLDPVNSVSIEREKPYLYCFRTSKAVGYSAHFVGNCLIFTSMKVKGKGYQHCVKYEFQPRRWYMLAVVYIYNRWSKSEIKCFVNGQLASATEMSWLVSTNDPFDKCYIGASPELDEEHLFSGQMSAIYLFSEALSTHQVCGIHRLGPGYQAQFRFEGESPTLSESLRRVLYDGKLAQAMLFCYNPVATDSQLCLQAAPKMPGGSSSGAAFFVHNPHALMLQEVRAVTTHGIHSTLNSIGGLQMLFPLLGQLDYPVHGADHSDANSAKSNGICATLIGFICEMCEGSTAVQQHMIQNKGFLVISQQLRKASRHHLSESVLQSFLALARHLLTLSTPNGELLLKHLLDHVLFNPALWIYTPTPIQIRLYSYLATEFLADTQIYGNVRRVSTVLQTMHILKYYYWVANPAEKSGIVPKGADGPRPAPPEILSIRAYLLLFLKQLIVKGSGPKEDELQSCLNYLTTVHEDDNLHDVLQMMIGLMAEQPATMVPAFDCRAGVRAVFKLLGSPSETVRLQALKLLAFFLSRSTHKRKHDVMSPHNLYMLLVDRLLLNADHLTLATYNVLYEMLTEHIGAHILYTPHAEPEHHFRLENPMVLKVVASLLRQSKHCDELMEVKRLFLSDLSLLCNASRENRRTVLQMSVWQEWLVALAYVHPQDQEQRRISETVFALFRTLLHHAIKYEYGGWRVWVDTLAIVHSRVAYEEYQLHYAQMHSTPTLHESPSPGDEVASGGGPAASPAEPVRALSVALSATTPSQEPVAPSLAEASSNASNASGHHSTTSPASSSPSSSSPEQSQLSQNQQRENYPYREQTSSSLASSPERGRRGLETAGLLHVEQVVITEDGQVVCTAGSQETIEEKSDDGTEKELHADAEEKCQGEGEATDISKLVNDIKADERGDPAESAGSTQLASGVELLPQTIEEVSTKNAEDELRSEETIENGDSAQTKGEQGPKPSSSIASPEIPEGLAGIHRRSVTSPHKALSTTISAIVETSRPGGGVSGHSEDSVEVASKEEHHLATDPSKGGVVYEQEIRTLEDVSLSEEEERASSGSPQMIDCPAIESPAPSHTSQVSASSGIDHEPHEGRDDDGREKHETEGEKEIPIDAALVTELSCDTIESSSMPLSPLLEKKAAEQNAKSQAPLSSSSGEMVEIKDDGHGDAVGPVDAGSGGVSASVTSSNRERICCSSDESKMKDDVVGSKHISTGNSGGNNNSSSSNIIVKKVEAAGSSSTGEVNERLTLGEPGSAGGLEQVVSTIDAQLQHTSYRGLEVDSEKVAGVHPTDGAERVRLEDLAPGATEPAAKLRTKTVSFANSSGETYPAGVYTSGHSSGPGFGSVGSNNNNNNNSTSNISNSNASSNGSSSNSSGNNNNNSNNNNINNNSESGHHSNMANNNITGGHIANSCRGDSGAHSTSRHMFNSGPSRPPFRIPEFRWSAIHQRLLSDLLYSLETDIQLWRSHSTKTIMDFVNSSDNAIFVVNTVHLISQLSDNIVIACGGLLPLLAAATSPTHELDVVEPTQGLSSEMSFAFLQRLVHLADVLVFASSLSFSELESEKNMASGGILRQCLRLVCTNAVRTCLDGRIKLPPPQPVSAHHPHHGSSQAGGPGGHAMASALQRMRNDLSGSLMMQVKEPEKLLQDMDVNRLRAVIYRDDETKQAQFLALAVVYFISVLMVSKYRDILEPASPHTERRDREQRAAYDSNNGRLAASSCHHSHSGHGHASGEDSDILANLHSSSIPIIPTQHLGQQSQSSAHTYCHQKNAHVSSAGDEVHGGSNKNGDFGRTNQAGQGNGESREASLTQKLETALCGVCPLLREIMVDFAPFLSKTLVGSHGQDLLVEGKGLNTFKNSSSVVELVMLLCSQEWQNSLQKHAGLAFIELINEGRLLSHAMKDHIVRVANEADFILNRMRADDVIKHADFEQLCGQTAAERRDEESMCDHLITAARRRDAVVAQRMIDKVHNMLTNRHGAWRDQRHLQLHSQQQQQQQQRGVPAVRTGGDAADTTTHRRGREPERIEHLKLDSWEDDARRRRRFVRNLLGSPHRAASLRAEQAHGQFDGGDAAATAAAAMAVSREREELHRQLAAQRRQTGSPGGELAGGQPTEAAEYWEDKELDAEYTGSVSLSTRCRLIAPGITAPGTLSVTQSELFFEVDEEDAEFKKNCPRVLKYCEHIHGKWHFSEIRAVFSRRYLLQNVALEIFLASRTSIMFAFDSAKTVKKVVKALPQVGVGIKYGIGQTRRASLMTPRQIFQQSNMTQKWQRREISNFEYLMFLNTIAGRTYSDLNQYPIFPWVLTNYESAELDLSLPSNYRDLSKPIGALNPSRKQFFEERYETWEHDVVPPFHYGTHYSTAAFTLNWLLRLEPSATMFIALQDGKFDHPDRLFSSVAQSWRNCQRDTSDVKELIPEFFYLPEMFLNQNGFRLGTREDGHVVDDVQLPPWANGSAEEFVRIHRMALESEIVSCQLHQWIDLVFGYKQRGPEAVRSANVFYYLTYEGNVDLESIKDPVMREAIEDQIKNFGMTPSQLLLEPHPPRSSAMHISPLMFSPVADEVCMVIKFLSNSPIVHISANTYPQLPAPSVVTVAANHNFAVNRWNPNFSTPLHGGGGGPAGSYHHDVSSQSGPGQQNSQVLPLSMDPLLMMNVSPHKRHLGDSDFSQQLKVRPSCFVTTVDSRFIIAAGFWDKSFRVFATESAKTLQIVYAHFGVVTCLARSECNITSDCYVASGSEDCTVLLWHWNARTQSIAGDNANPDVPTPRASLSGHESEVTCIVVSAELGLVVSGSRAGAVLVHTTAGDLLRSIQGPEHFRSPHLVCLSREGTMVVCYDLSNVCAFNMNGKQLRAVTHHDDIGCCALSRDGEYLITGGDSGVVEVWRTYNLALLYAFPACEGAVRSVALSHDQRFLITGLSNGSITVFYIDFNRWHHEYQQRY